jgi:hypothetical protein
MTLLRRTFLVGMVWLAAAGTLLAGFPRLECLCPANVATEKQSAPAKRGCCCCGGECASGEGCPSCGRAAQSPDEDDPAVLKASGPALKRVPCQRVPVRAEIVTAVDNAANKAAAGHAVALAGHLCLTHAILSSFVSNQRDSRAIHLLPPPTDLVTVLQHFLN